MITNPFDTQKKINSANTNSDWEKTFVEFSNETTTGNGGKAYKNLDNIFIEDITRVGEFKTASFIESKVRLQEQWKSDKLKAVVHTFLIRNITRKHQCLNFGSKNPILTKGFGIRKEFLYRAYTLLSMYKNNREFNIKFLSYTILVGRWKDIFELLYLDLITTQHWDKRKLNWEVFKDFIFTLLKNKSTSELLKKYLPSIKANSKIKNDKQLAKNIVAKWLVSELFDTNDEASKIKSYKSYRKLKSSGTAHKWQQLISQKRYNEINFDTIPGKALSMLVSAGSIDKFGLTKKYNLWIENKDVSKIHTVQFPHELFPLYDKDEEATFNKQFLSLVEKTKGESINDKKILLIMDTSGSMTSTVKGLNISSFRLEAILQLYFHYTTGSNIYGMFSNTIGYSSIKGLSPYDKLKNMLKTMSNFNWGSTNPVSVAKSLGKIYNKSGIESLPDIILMTSDGEFNSYSNGDNLISMKREFDNILADYNIPKEYIDKLAIVLWDIRNDFYDNDRKRVYDTNSVNDKMIYLSGFDPSIVEYIYKGEVEKLSTRYVYEQIINQKLYKDIAKSFKDLV